MANSLLSDLSYISPAAAGLNALSSLGSQKQRDPLQIQQVQRFNPQQQNILQQLLSMGQANLQNPLEGFDAFKNRANQQFQEETVPGILERFSGDALSSPSLKSELSQAGGSLAERLSGLEGQYRQGREQLGMQQIGQGLTPQFENLIRGENEGLLPGLTGGLSQGFAAALPLLLKLLMSLA